MVSKIYRIITVIMTNDLCDSNKLLLPIIDFTDVIETP